MPPEQIEYDNAATCATYAKSGFALVDEPTGVQGWLGPYLKSTKATNDPWGRPLQYAVGADGSASVTSLGADGKAGGKGPNQDLTEMAR